MTENHAHHDMGIRAVVQQLEQTAHDMAAGTASPPNEFDIDLAARLLSSAARIHCAAVTRGDPEGRGNRLAINPTEAVTAANAMLDSQALSVFEFSLWTQASKAHSTTHTEPNEGEN